MIGYFSQYHPRRCHEAGKSHLYLIELEDLVDDDIALVSSRYHEVNKIEVSRNLYLMFSLQTTVLVAGTGKSTLDAIVLSRRFIKKFRSRFTWAGDSN